MEEKNRKVITFFALIVSSVSLLQGGQFWTSKITNWELTTLVP